MNHANLLAA